MTRNIGTLETARQFAVKMNDNPYIDHDSMEIHDCHGQMDGHDTPRDVAHFHVITYRFKESAEVDDKTRFVLFGIESLPRAVKYALITQFGTDAVVPCFNAGGSADDSPDPAYRLFRPMLSHSAKDRRSPMMWAAGRAVHLHIGDVNYPIVPAAPTDIERTALFILGWPVYAEHLGNDGQWCEYSGTSVGSFAGGVPCPRCGERGVEPVLMPDGLAAGLATIPGAKEAARDILANVGMIP